LRREQEPDDDLVEAIDVAESQRDRLGAALAELQHGVIVVDARGDEVYRNPAAERYRAARHADAVAAAAIAELLEQVRGGRAINRELQLFGPPRAVLQLHAVPLGENASLGAAVVVYDVSEIHRVDSVRRDFVANVSHELKTPIGALEVLAETLVTEDDPAVTRRLAESMVKEAERLGRIVDDLLDLSLIETQEAPRREPVPVSVLLEDAIDRVRAAADSANIEIKVDDAAAGAIIGCDRRQLVSAIANLLDNAVKYSEPASGVCLETVVADGRLVIAVTDQGIGIPSRDLERIFERFYRVDYARSRATGGTGLGLAIVRHVVQAHGGEVTVESVEGQGSTFRVTLPLDGVDLRDRTNGVEASGVEE
jgi:two-component system, OmpR family, sensor histidine kinase SenX3